MMENEDHSVAKAAKKLNNTIRGDDDDKWEEVIRQLSDAEKKGIEADILQHRVAFVPKKEIGDERTLYVLLLHVVCAFDAPLKVVLLFVAGSPNTVGARDEHSNTPLHYACLYGASDDVIEVLADKFLCASHAKEIRGSKGRTPLHWYFANAEKNDDPSLDVVKSLCTRSA